MSARRGQWYVKWALDFEGKSFYFLARWKMPDEIGPHFDTYGAAKAESDWRNKGNPERCSACSEGRPGYVTAVVDGVPIWKPCLACNQTVVIGGDRW